MTTPLSLGALLVVSGPSGCGKTTLCKRLREEQPERVYYSTSCTTRSPRPGEENGVDYYFLSIESFREKIGEKAFLEYAEVHGNFYGTLVSEVLQYIEVGKDVILDIDVQGAALVRACDHPAIRQAYSDLFIHVPEMELRQRLEGRQTDSEEVIALRLKNAAEESSHSGLYQHCFDSADKETDYARFIEIMEKARAKAQTN